MSNQIGVSGSTCTNGTAVGVSTFGGGWVTEVDAGPPLTGTARQNHYFLGLQVGGTSVQVSFDAVMVPFNDPVSPPDVPNPQLPIDFGLAGEVHFDNATGTGVMLETCTFDAASDVITCTDEGSFASD